MVRSSCATQLSIAEEDSVYGDSQPAARFSSEIGA